MILQASRGVKTLLVIYYQKIGQYMGYNETHVSIKNLSVTLSYVAMAVQRVLIYLRDRSQPCFPIKSLAVSMRS